MTTALTKTMVLERLAAGLPGGAHEALFAQACARAGVADKGSYHPAEVALVGKAMMDIATEALAQIDLKALAAMPGPEA